MDKNSRRSSVKKLYTEHKTLKYFTGTPEILGVTIVLHSESNEELVKVKNCLKRMIWKAWEVYLESEFLLSLQTTNLDKD